ncbi:MAG: GNAT family N-acetyltransferase [Anaerolineae bacterium]
MELANVSSSELANRVRVAELDDARAINRMLRRVPNSHIHVDWRLPLDWLGTDGFVVVPEPVFSTGQRQLIADKFLPPTRRLIGCLAAVADPPPAAWVRLASVAAVADSQAVLAVMLTKVIEFLRETAVTQLGWLAVQSWPNAWLPELGFVRANEIETYVKEDDWLPPVTAVPHLTIRPVQSSDMPRLEAIERAAFAPLWRHSADTLTLASQQALCFDVAEIDQQIVAFQLSSRTEAGAHLVRLTVDPAWQQQGVGSAVLNHTLQTYHRYGLHQVSLNTQLDNISSQILYRKFGFSASGQRFPVWVFTL